MICAPQISQVAGIAALSGGTAQIQEFERILAGRRELICLRIDRLPQVFQYTKPEGAYYLFLRIIAQHEVSFEFSLRLLKEARVSVTPGNAFGPSGEHHVRLAFVLTRVQSTQHSTELNNSCQANPLQLACSTAARLRLSGRPIVDG